MRLYESLLEMCLNKAWEYQTLALENPSVACMVLDKNHEILSLETHKKAKTPHAEVLAAQSALKILRPSLKNDLEKLEDPKTLSDFLKTRHDNAFTDCVFLITLEPCNSYGKTPACSELLEILKPKRVVIATEENEAKKGGLARLQKARIETMICHNLENKAKDLLLPFRVMEQKGRFNLFKLALRMNGDYHHGKITGQKSVIFTHNQRAVCDTLIISGKTIRTDNPLLDSRFCDSFYHNKNPNIAILSKHSISPHSKVFSAPNRLVNIFNNPKDLPLEKGFNFIEGGWGLFESLRDKIDALLLHSHASMISEAFSAFALKTPFKGRLLHVQILENEALLWIENS
ncbi:bifunctional diaminohydroxyphosphoribosylaminopyrimidine deaminase/5-amino-6-(5-phosphoribosylamino)uracil reductase [Helicobacter pylori]|uniref:Bifunctional diaminohydroxyphosphoribosylaminopyrimidine deaminase/5-amino-6-(5-phosphoribosylamino)uracil reductase n=2 Tax=Helicobacter pylori TaxID=210 RepID=A0A3N5CCX3_HELPX|nr:bifunctional diaminohydroxyphosphoribosylaminopyrimidine deaminase/5-amino-6-(5-phosphoribosylamino)uracil reductase [Helicobacter pylori]NHA64774.1 bifunctional diaminohydroxyphosphoribosylaminopyrimidine deaminase/5-amino-6-(5-phosphoribosylamino)uracil reductase [Helicobacter pylori]OOQ39571.1 bifunctional diaminohydroxyphosphoribosylaminopyrimidine deaminase/5-amino-6-(5-phosphoribosylamino)uracil reductase [Helicobacter pylori]PDX45548.1 bifunctional diaminohydroxyphosphoribosylaminopyri